jgi:hypothetical protein
MQRQITGGEATRGGVGRCKAAASWGGARRRGARRSEDGAKRASQRGKQSGESGVGFGREGERDGRACRDCMRDVSAKCPSRRVFRAGGSTTITQK